MTATIGFDCPNCGDTTGFPDGADADEIRGNVFECDGCGASVLIE